MTNARSTIIILVAFITRQINGERKPFTDGFCCFQAVLAAREQLVLLAHQALQDFEANLARPDLQALLVLQVLTGLLDFLVPWAPPDSTACLVHPVSSLLFFDYIAKYDDNCSYVDTIKMCRCNKQIPIKLLPFHLSRFSLRN